jgi:UDP-glucose 4-epimerase
MTDTTDTERGEEATDGETTDEVEPIETPTIAVTGAAGYIGSRVVVEFQEDQLGWEIVALNNGYRAQVDSTGDVEI